jgi:hypothetical protein
MSFISEDRYCQAWMAGLSQSLHEEGGLWEILGRSIGWPVGERDGWLWMTWEEARDFYAAGSPDADVAEVPRGTDTGPTA